jgi:Minor capsid protein
MTSPIIETPRGAIFVTEQGKASLKWNTSFQPTKQAAFTRAQKFLDSEILRGCEPYTPLLTGTLIKSGILGTQIGSGTVHWIAPYAKAQYYSPRKAGSTTGPLRGPYWFERWKAADGRVTLARAKMLAGQ